MNIQRICTATLIVIAYLFTPAAFAQSSPSSPSTFTQSSMIGSWYGEIATSDQYDGRDVDHRSWLRINKPDGEQIIIFRYYLGEVVQGEEIQLGRWELNNRVYTTTCESLIYSGRIETCDAQSVYDVTRLDATEMLYTSRTSGTAYRATRVAGDFQLP